MTVAAIVDRLFRTYLYPPDAQPAQCSLNGGITDTATSLILDNFVLPEDELLMAAGVIIEINSELIKVITYDSPTLTATLVERGVMGTTKVAQVDDANVILSPPYARLSVFAAVADNIITLYPRLFTVTAGSVIGITSGIATLDDPLAVEVVECWPDGTFSSQEVDARIVDFHPSTGGRALITNVQVGQVWVRYRRRFGDAVDESATLASLGMEERWVNIVMAGAAADIFAGRDLPASETRWVGAALEAENIPVGTRSSLARQLAAYRDHLLGLAQREMKAEYRTKIHMRSATQVVVRSPWG